MPTFQPPVATDRSLTCPDAHPLANRLLRHFGSGTRGRSVLKEGGVYRTVDSPSADDVANADVAYLGGHVYTVSEAEKTALEAAGYSVDA